MKLDRIHTFQNDYKHVSEWRTPEGRTIQYGLRIFCSECSHSEVTALPSGYAYTIGQSFADKIFRNKGWMLGRKRKFDICPSCQARPRKALPTALSDALANAQSQLPLLTIVPPKKEPPMNIQTQTRAQPAPEADKKRIHVTPSQTVAVHEALKGVLKILDSAKNLVSYIDGWDDERVAKQVGELSASQVANLRVQMFGKLYVRVTKHSLEDRVKSLEERILALEDLLTRK